MNYIDPDWLKRERQEPLEKIESAFRDVSRDGGVSWSETFVIDDYGSEEERLAARASDVDRHWNEVLIDDTWRPALWSGGFCFLDAIGYRYYLPAAMVWTIHRDHEHYSMGLSSHLKLPADETDERAYLLEQWSLLNTDQRRTVGRFLRYMEAHQGALDESWAEWWREAHESYWARDA